MSGGLLHFWDEDRSALKREARGLVGADAEPLFRGGRRVSRFFCRLVCKIRYIFRLENPFMSRFISSVAVLVFPYGYRTIPFICVIV